MLVSCRSAEVVSLSKMLTDTTIDLVVLVVVVVIVVVVLVVVVVVVVVTFS